MAASVHQFNKIQIGEETVKGTSVPATVEIVADVTQVEEQDFHRSALPAGQRATPGAAGVVLRHGTIFTVETELTPHDILWPLHTGVRGNITSVAGTGDETWTFLPELTTSAITLDSATVEYVRGDGTTNHYYGESAYCLTSAFRIEWAFNEIAKLSWDMFGRRRQTGTPTPALTPYAGRAALTSNLTSIFVDDTGAGIGASQLTTILRSGRFECPTGIEPDYTLDGLADQDFTIHKVSNIGATLQLVLEFDAASALEFADFRNNVLRFIRMITTGAVIGAKVFTVQVDGAYRHVTPPQFTQDGDQVIVTLDLEAVYDATWGKILEFELVNDISTI